MHDLVHKKVVWLSIGLIFNLVYAVSETTAQNSRETILQTITIKSGKKTKLPLDPMPRIRKTVKSVPKKLPTKYIKTESFFRTTIPALANVEIPGRSGILVETLEGKILLQTYAHAAFNPASNVKVATAYAILKMLGPNYRFKTMIYTDGTIDHSSKTLRGNLYFSGGDPAFSYQHAISIAKELNLLGITKVDGDLIVSNSFVMNFNRYPIRSGNKLLNTLNGVKRNATAKKAWKSHISNSDQHMPVGEFPSVFFTGKLYVHHTVRNNSRLLFMHESAPLREIIKAMMIFSNNFLAARLGNMLGGPHEVARIVQLNAGISPFEFSLATSSGLGLNRVTPRAQMKLLRTLRAELKKYGMTFTDIMSVAGIDKGTLAKRFDESLACGSVVGKTGTLGATDGGVSSLSGEVKTRQGALLFVIFNQRGSIRQFRDFQDNYIPLIQNLNGGAVPLSYQPIPIERRLAKSRVRYPKDSHHKP